MCVIDWDIIIKFLTLGLAAYSLIRGISEYARAQKWKKAEFLAKEYKDFVASPYVQNSFQMLDDFRLTHQILKEDGTQVTIIASPGTLTQALTKKDGNYPGDAQNTYLRLCIDKFLFKMGLFQNHINNDVIAAPALKNYISYWIELIGDKDNKCLDNKLRTLLHEYIKENKFASVMALFATYDYPIV